MANRTFLTAHSAIYAFFALALFFLLDVLWPNYGLQVNDEYARFLSQYNSIFLGGIAIIGFLFRDAGHGTGTATKILTGLMATNALGAGITLYACLTGVFSGFGWSDPIFFALLTVLSYLQIKRNR